MVGDNPYFIDKQKQFNFNSSICLVIEDNSYLAQGDQTAIWNTQCDIYIERKVYTYVLKHTISLLTCESPQCSVSYYERQQ